jgi:hypothetical protein
VVVARLGLALPLSVAVVEVTSVAAVVVTVGGAAVVNDTMVPTEVPSAFWAIAQTK